MSQHKLPECPAFDAIPDKDQCNVTDKKSISPTFEEEVTTLADVPITAEEKSDLVHDIPSIPAHPDEISEDKKRVQQLHRRQSDPLCSAHQDKLLAPRSFAEESIVSQRQQSTQEVEDLSEQTKEKQEDSEKDEMQSVDLQTHSDQGNPVSIRKRSSNSGSYCLLASNSSSSVDVREVISRFNSLNDEWEQAGSDQTSVRGKISRISGTSSFHSSITPAMDIPRISDIPFEINSVDNDAMATNVKSADNNIQSPKDIRTINEGENGDDNRPQASPPEVVQIIQNMVTNVVKDGDPENQENVPPESSLEHNQLDGGKQIVVIKKEEIVRKFKDSDWLCPTYVNLHSSF